MIKSVKSLYEENYEFERAIDELAELIESEFKKDKSIVTIPNTMVTYFHLNIKKTRLFFKELEELGYGIVFSEDKIQIMIGRNNNVLFVENLIKSDINKLIDEKNHIELISTLIKNDFKNWKKRSSISTNLNMFSYEIWDDNRDSFFGEIVIDFNKKIMTYKTTSSKIAKKVVFLNNPELFLFKNLLTSINIEEKQENIEKNYIDFKNEIEKILVKSNKIHLIKDDK